MATNKIFRLIFSLLLVSQVTIINAGEQWVRHLNDDKPWVSALSVSQFKDRVYVVGSSGGFTPDYKVWQSPDFNGWDTNNNLPTSINAPLLHANESYIYALLNNGRSPYPLYRSSDGQTWHFIQSFPSTSFEFFKFQMVSSGNHIYIYLGNRPLYKSIIESDGQNWEELTIPFPNFVNTKSLHFKDVDETLHIGWVDSLTLEPNRARIAIVNPDNSFAEIGSVVVEGISTNFGKLKLVHHNDDLYLGYGKVWKTHRNTAPLEWIEQNDIGNFDHKPAVVFETIHTFSPTSGIKIYTNQAWNSGSPNLFSITNDPVVVLNDTAFLRTTNADFWSLKLGLIEVSLDPPPSTPLFTGESSSVLSFSTESNIRDEIMFTVRNSLGTCLAGRDIERLWAGTTNNPKAVELSTQGTDQKTWAMLTSLPVVDETDVVLTAKVALGARIGSTCIFSIAQEELTSIKNPGFRMNGVLQSSELEIKVGAQAAQLPLTKQAQVFPQPAKDIVSFRYNLDTLSDVTIKIFDREGVLIHQFTETGKLASSTAQSSWNVRSVPAGVYFAHFEIQPINGSKRTFTKRVYVDK